MAGLMDVVKGAVNAVKAGAALAQQAVSQPRQQQIANDVRDAPRGEKGAALAVHLQQIEQSNGNQAAAQAFAVRSIPAVRALRDRTVVAQFDGAQPEAVVV